MSFSYGFVETRGYVAAIEAADAMVKTAKVDIIKWRKAGGALVMVIVKGELDACRAAVDAGSAAADRIGELVSANVIPNPYGDTSLLIEQYLGGRKKKQQAKKPSQIQKKKAAHVSPKVEEARKQVPAPKKSKPVSRKTRTAQPTIKKPALTKTKPTTKSKVASTKTARPKKGASFSPQERLLSLITVTPAGITVNQLAEEFNKPVAKVRQLIKKLMDRNVIEKVQKRYFIIDSRSKK